MTGPRFSFTALPAPVREEMNRLQTEALQAKGQAKEAEKARSREEANQHRAQIWERAAPTGPTEITLTIKQGDEQ